MVREILAILGKGEELIEYVADRPGHDFRYRLDSSKALRELGFRAATAWPEGLRQTVNWCLANRYWLLAKA